MDKKISEIFDQGDEIVVLLGSGEGCDPAEIKELTMKRIHDEAQEPISITHAAKKARSARRTALIAACAAVLLAGTALAAYRYTLRDAAIEDVPTRDSELYEWKAGQTETQLSLNGFSDSPEYRAFVEWEEWNRAWNAEHPDPWGEIGEDDAYHETPDNYIIYGANFAEQGEALDAIAAKYGLELLSTSHFVRAGTQLSRALGVDGIAAEGWDIQDGYFFDNGAFAVSGQTDIGGARVYFNLLNSVKGSFLPFSGVIPEDHTEWSYATEDGFDVILMTDTARGTTRLIAPLSGSFITGIIATDDPQAAQDFADAIDLAALDALFATDAARAAAARSIAAYVEGRSSETTLDDISAEQQAVLSYLGDWYFTELPEGCVLFSMEAEGPDHFSDFYSVSRSYNGGGVYVSLSYRELDPLDGGNEEARLSLSTYTVPRIDPMDTAWLSTPCTVSGYDAVLTQPSDTGSDDYILSWIDSDRQLFFRVTSSSASAEQLLAMAESITGTAPETPPVRTVSTAEERFRNSVMPLDRVSIMSYYGVGQDVEVKRLLSELGNYGLTVLPQDAEEHIVSGWRQYMYEYYWDGRADWNEVWKIYHFDPELGADGLTFSYKRFDGGRTAEAFAAEKRYDDYYGDVSDCKVGTCDGYIAGGDFFGGVTFAEWYDADRDMIFKVSFASLVYDMTEDELLAMAESVTEQAWTGAESARYLQGAENVLAELGAYDLPGAAYGSITWASDTVTEDWVGAPLWYVEDAPYAGRSLSATYADGLMLSWQRTWADMARTAENGADSFAAITEYLLACDDSGAVRTGLTVNGHDAICVSFPGGDQWSGAHTELIWYDADAGLIFGLADFPGEDGAPRTEAQLIALAETVAAK